MNITKKILGGIGVLVLAAFSLPAGCPMGTTPEATSPQQKPHLNSNIMLSSAPNLGLAATFAVFGGGAGITNQGTATAITGDMGTTGASTMITGFHSSVFSYVETPLNVGAVSGTVYTNAPQGTR